MNCAACGGTIVQGIGTDKEFCSVDCFRTGRALCKFCDMPLPMSTNGSKRVFCNKVCSSRYFNMSTNPLREKARSTCKRCGEPITQSKNRLRVFCSKSCRDSFYREEKYKKDITQEWGTFAPETRKSLHEVQLLMGIGAANRLANAISREYILRGKDNAVEARVSCRCKTCGKKFSRRVWSYKSKDYCSPKCNPSIGRGRLIENAPSARVTWEQVDEIRHLYTTENVSRREIGRRYGIGYQTVGQIVTYRTWKPENDPRQKAINV